MTVCTEQIPGGYVVRDANDQSIAYVYSRSDESEARQAKVLTADEARRIALNIARLPELLAPCLVEFHTRDSVKASGKKEEEAAN